MNAPLYRIPGAAAAAAPLQPAAPQAQADEQPRPSTVGDVLQRSQVESVITELDADLIGLAPIKARVRDIAALLVIDKLRAACGLQGLSLIHI